LVETIAGKAFLPYAYPLCRRLHMARILDRFEYPEGLFYSADHLWVKREDGSVRVGVTDMAQQAAGSILFVRLMPKGRKVEFGKPLGTMETGKWVGPLKSPLSGTIVESNEALKTQPKLLNEDPYGKGWLAVLQPSKLGDELKNLMSDLAQIEKFTQAELPKLFKK
jgi:glycine cleavage system H protein